jgi:hypothetical protein
MDDPDPLPWFVGDLADPWVSAIAEALSPGARRFDAPGPLPDSWPEGWSDARRVVVHRAHLTDGDRERLGRLKAEAGQKLRLILCVGPQPRYRDVERWAPMVEAVLPEAIARETIARHVGGTVVRAPGAVRPRIAVVSALHELRMALADACREAGYPVEPAADFAATSARRVVWDVPVLEDDWPRRLAHEARSRAVVALMGFADRATVDLARSRGASACLDLPCDPADLAFVLDRLFAEERVGDPAHVVPPDPAGLRRAGRLGRTGRRYVE